MARENILKVVIGADDKTQAAFKSATANATKFGAAVTAAMAGAVTMSAKFETGMAEIQTLLGKEAAPAVAKMGDELKDLSVQTGQTLGALAKARYDIISAGFADGAEGAEVMAASVDVARGGLVDAATAADLMTSALNGMGLEASMAGEVADDLFTIVKLGKTTMGELAQGMGKVFATAKTARVSLDEVGAAMAVITAAGIDTNEAATSLNQLLVALAAPSGEAKDALEELGITLDDGLGPALEALGKAGGESLAKLQELIPNIRALKAAAAAGGDIEAFNRALAQMGDNSGDAKEAVEIMADTLTEQLKVLRQQVQVLAVDIGDTILPAVNKFVGNASELVGKLRELPQPLQEFGVKATLALGGVSLLAGGVGKLLIAVDGLIVAMGRLAGTEMMKLLIGAGAGIAGLAAVANSALLVTEPLAGAEVQRRQQTGMGPIPTATGGMYMPGSFGAPSTTPQRQMDALERMMAAQIGVGVGGLGMGSGGSSSAIAAALAGAGAGGGGSAVGGLVSADTTREATMGARGMFGESGIGVADIMPVTDALQEFTDSIERDIWIEGLGALEGFEMPEELKSENVSQLAADFREFGLALAEGVVGNMWAFGDAAAQAIVYGAEFGESMKTALKSIAAQLVATIIQFLALKVVVKSLLTMTGFGGIATVLGLASGTSFVQHAPLHAASGFMSVPSGGGGDVVPAMLTPGEMVLSKDRADMMRTALYQPELGGRSLLRKHRSQRGGVGAMVVGVKDTFTGSEAVDFEDIQDRADWRSEGLR